MSASLSGRDALTDPALQRRLHRYASALCRRPADVEDIVQETLASALLKLHQLGDADSIVAWVCSIARNVYLQQRRTSLFAPQTMVSLDEIGGAAAAGPDPERLTTCRMRMVAVRDAVRKLPPHYREIVYLRDFSQFSNAEVAARLGLTADVAKTRLHRAHQLVRVLCRGRV